MVRDLCQGGAGVQVVVHGDTVYLAGNVVFKSTDFGKSWATISPDLTTNDKAKQKGAGGPVAFENTGAEYHTTVISLAESPLKAGTIWAGTDDGNLQVTTDGGRDWRNLTKNLSASKTTAGPINVEIVMEGNGIKLIVPTRDASRTTDD